MRAHKSDAHVHVWPDHREHAYDDCKAPPCAGSHDDLIAAMDANDVRTALIVQPINLGFDHGYVESAIKAHPGRFVGMALANPKGEDGGARELERLLASGKFRGVRFNPGLWPEGEGMDGAIGRRLFRVCAACEPPAVVGFMCFHGLAPHVAAIRALCEAEPKVPVLIDHFGFTKGVDDPAFEDLLQLGRDFQQVNVKCSAHFRVRVSTEDGSDSTAEQLAALVTAFGRERILWGSDYPFVTMENGDYAGAVGVIDSQIKHDPELLANIMGRNFERVFPGALR